MSDAWSHVTEPRQPRRRVERSQSAPPRADTKSEPAAPTLTSTRPPYRPATGPPGLAGVTIHAHAPGENLNDNVITGNMIGTNNLGGDSDFASLGTQFVDSATTGVIVAAMSPVTVTITHNTINGDTYAVWLGSPAAVGVFVSGLATNAMPNTDAPEFAAT